MTASIALSALPPALLRLGLALGLCLGPCTATAAFTRDGDYTIAGLFPIHRLPPRAATRPRVDTCDNAQAFQSHGYHLFQTMRLTVEEINDSSSLLPNVSLGYDVYDTCSESANVHATLRALTPKGQHGVPVLPALGHHKPAAVAVIGPDSTQLALTTAAILSVFLTPEISYEASVERLSLKRLYPSFLRTIPSDRQQVKAISLLLQRFGWTWVALLGSDNAYGRAGLEALQELLSAGGICVAYQDVLPPSQGAGGAELRRTARILTDIRVNVTVVFSSKEIARSFFEVAVQENVTGMVWVGTEDWALAQAIWQVPGIRSVGSVIGVSVQQTELRTLRRSEPRAKAGTDSGGAGGGRGERAQPSCARGCTGCRSLAAAPDERDARASASVYTAVYAVAHGLHSLLGCASGACSKRRVYPWQLLEKIKQVNFSLHENQISFDANGEILKGYDIIMWKWRGTGWSSDVVGSFSVNPERLSIDPGKMRWHTKDNQAPASLCSQDCRPGHRRLQYGRHRCCFSCVACPQGTFLNTTDPYTCQPCGGDEWAPPGSERCLQRADEFLPWDDPVAWAVLCPATLLLLLVAALAVLFARNLSTPLVKSAGGKLCFVMLGAQACACGSVLCYVGEPTWLCCALRLPLFSLSFAVLLSSVAARAVQLACIFARGRCQGQGRVLRALRAAGARRGAPALLVAGGAAVQAALCALAAGPAPRGCARYGARAAAPLLFNVLLGAACFAASYAGRELPGAYSEARSAALALLLHAASSACALGARGARAALAGAALCALGALGALLGGAFVPRARALLLRPERATAARFRAALRRAAP